MDTVALFSKHLGWLTIDQLGPTAAEMGLTAVQLTVRPGGHIEPERAEADLARAVRTLRLAGVSVPSVCTSVTDPADELTRRVVGAIAQTGIPIYRMGWYRRPPGSSAEGVRSTHDEAARGLAGFSELNEELGLRGCYQNHAGPFVGASPWELWELVRELPAAHLGIEFDPRHARIEGWASWEPAFELLEPWIAAVDVKDFVWEADAQSPAPPTAAPRSVPLGEGLVGFDQLLARLDHGGFDGPLIVHAEYEVAGRELQGTPGSVAGAPRDPFTAAAAAAIRADLEALRRVMPAASSERDGA